jgi:hypothetical protein
MEWSILHACDETEMNMNTFAKECTHNIREQENVLRKLEKEEAEGIVCLRNAGRYEDLPLFFSW